MFFTFFIIFAYSAKNDEEPLITQRMIDKINMNPGSTFKAFLYQKFKNLSQKQMRKRLAPVRKIKSNHGSARPLGFNEDYFNPSIVDQLYSSSDREKYPRIKYFLNNPYLQDKSYFSGLDRVMDWPSNGGSTTDIKNKYQFPVYDNSRFCSSWIPSVTTAMSMALSFHSKKFINLSVQFLLDCDIMGDPCIDRPPLNAYQPFWEYYIPQSDRWDQPKDLLRSPHPNLTSSVCADKSSYACYPGWSMCPKNRVLSGECAPGVDATNCPVYYLYNLDWIKSHLAEVGPVTSSFLVHPDFFSYSEGVYSTLGNNPNKSQSYFDEKNIDKALGMLDVTIIGWGQTSNEQPASNENKLSRWWYVIPHLGTDFGANCTEIFGDKDIASKYFDFNKMEICNKDWFNEKTGIVKFSMGYDDSGIESLSAGAVPFNFNPEETPVSQ